MSAIAGAVSECEELEASPGHLGKLGAYPGCGPGPGPTSHVVVG